MSKRKAARARAPARSRASTILPIPPDQQPQPPNGTGEPGAAPEAAPVPPVSVVLFGVMSQRRTPVGAWFRPEHTAIAHWIAEQEHLSAFEPVGDAVRTVGRLLSEWQLRENRQRCG